MKMLQTAPLPDKKQLFWVLNHLSMAFIRAFLPWPEKPTLFSKWGILRLHKIVTFTTDLEITTRTPCSGDKWANTIHKSMTALNLMPMPNTNHIFPSDMRLLSLNADWIMKWCRRWYQQMHTYRWKLLHLLVLAVVQCSLKGKGRSVNQYGYIQKLQLHSDLKVHFSYVVW